MHQILFNASSGIFLTTCPGHHSLAGVSRHSPPPTCLLTLARAFVYKTPMSREEKLSQFAAWVQQNITSDEKGQPKIFLDRFLQRTCWPNFSN